MAESGLEGLITQLENTARELREGEISHARAAELVEQCAATAGEAVSELDRIARAAETLTDDQLRLSGT